jgi:hypothetical protein
MKQISTAKILGLAAALFLTGCTTCQTTWDNRVGIFTYNQAIVELGPPDQQTRLADHQTVAEWISRYRTGGSVGLGMDTGFYNGAASVGAMQTAPVYRESRLCLTFNTNHVLTAWSRK